MLERDPRGDVGVAFSTVVVLWRRNKERARRNSLTPLLLGQYAPTKVRTIVQRTLLPIVAGCVAAVFFAVPKPASATNVAVPAVHYGETNAGMVQEVGRRDWRGRRYVAPYAYGYRPYYRPYGYSRSYG